MSVGGVAHYRARLHSLRFGFSAVSPQHISGPDDASFFTPVSASCRGRTRRTRNEPIVVPESRLGHSGRRALATAMARMTSCLANWCREQENNLVPITRTSISKKFGRGLFGLFGLFARL